MHVRRLSVSQSDYANDKIPESIFPSSLEFNKPEISLLSLLLDHEGDDGPHDKFVGYRGD